MQRFYLTKYATDPQIGVVVAEGEVTAKQARIDPNRDHLTGYCRTFHFLEYVRKFLSDLFQHFFGCVNGHIPLLRKVIRPDIVKTCSMILVLMCIQYCI